MYFKRLELYGFKSFADKTRLDFEPGVTAIVGPNGCGKSNLADSIKWVLGEQSAKMLRGSRMEDVIFNGTDGKEPVNYAEVSLTLSNHDRSLPIEYDEVTVTRRLYRSGESEYLLNKTPVRLRDINELFIGTGIGTSAYSLIEQGRIDQVLSSKPEERREVFEEASGVTKFKAKKKEAMRRLEDTEQNLLRINDIIQEVQRQISSIERQARKAERYKERYEELKSLELKLARIELERLKQKLSLSNKELAELRSRESQLYVELERSRADLNELISFRSSIETKRMDFKSNILQIDTEISKSRDKISLDRERIEELKKKCAALASEIRKGEEGAVSQRREVEGLRKNLNSLEEGGAKRASLLKEKENKLDQISKNISECEINISTSKANVIDIASRQSKLRNQHARITANLNTYDARLKRLQTEKKTIEEEEGSLNVRFEDIIKELEILERDVRLLRSQRDKTSETISSLIKEIEELTERLTSLTSSLTSARSKLEMLEEAREKYEGFSSGVKAFLGKESSDAQIEGVQDVIVNLLSVKKGYEAALEAALGDNIQAVVVDNRDVAYKAIKFLKENSIGRAVFVYPEIEIDDPLLDIKDEGILGKAADFVQIDSRYTNIINYLLRDIYIVRAVEDAFKILLKETGPNQPTFVTLSGEVVKRNIVSGGDLKGERLALINRDIKIKELSETVSMQTHELKRLGERREGIEIQKEKLIEGLEELNKTLNEKEIQLADIRSKKANIEENIKGVRDEISLVNFEMDEVNTEIEKLKNEEMSVTKALEQAEKDSQLNNERIKKSEALIVEYTREREALLIEVAEYRTELGSLENKKTGLASTLQLLESSLKDSEESLNSRRRELEISLHKIKELGDEIILLEENSKHLSVIRIKRNSELGEIEAEYGRVVNRIDEKQGIFARLEEDINGIRSRLHEFDLKRTETNFSVDNLKQRIRDVYKTELGDIELDSEWGSLALDGLKAEVEEKREKLDSMGPVNLVAIEEHTELKDRFQFLTNQRDDLLKAKESLLKAIVKINKTIKELFIETFYSIQTEFRNYFKLLFGGGEGELILLDEGNVLESGIEIVARPPGKRLQNVSLLSGGEKALTAIALIFAIFKVKPSPFCVLDEIDAPLDESNVDRFSRTLEIFTKTSQFIIITHNKKTIDMADVMYGITMQESGISKVVSVKFSDGEKEGSTAK